MAIFNLRNMHFMMRKNYYMLHISHFGVCELREGEKENVFHFSYLSESSRNLKKNTPCSGPTADQSNAKLSGGMAWMCHSHHHSDKLPGLRRKEREGESENTAHIWLNSQRFTYLRRAFSPPYTSATHSANLHYPQP